MKFNFYLASFIACFLSLNSFAQRKQNVYFLKNNGRYVDNRDSADFTRIVQEPDSGSAFYNVLDYYPSGNLKMLGKSSTIDPIKLEGQSISYYPNKKKKRVCIYDKGIPAGEIYDYYPNGKMYRAIKFETHPPVTGYTISPIIPISLISWENVATVYDSLGICRVKTGNGFYQVYDSNFKYVLEEGKVKDGKRDSIWTGFSEDGKTIYKEGFIEGKFIKGQQIKINSDTIKYMVKEALPTFKNKSDSEFGKYVANSVVYPRSAIDRNSQGDVIVSFSIMEDGSIADVKIVKSLDTALDREVINVLKKSPKWSPAIQNGFPIKVSYTMLFSFAFTREVHVSRF